jgi:hypothetical protein
VVRFPSGAGEFSLLHSFRNGFGTYPAFGLMGTWGSLARGEANWKEREVFRSPPTNSEVKNRWSSTSTPARLHGVILH